MRILFVKPYAYVPNQIIDLPVGILYLSAYLKKHLPGRVEVDCIDLRLESSQEACMVERLTRFAPDVIGVSTLAFEKRFLQEYVPLFREHAPQATIIVGGPYATSNYDELLTQSGVDYVVVGEGEETLRQFVTSLLQGGNVRSIKGLAYREDHQVVCNESQPYIADLDGIPVADYDLVDLESYWGDHRQMNLLLAEERYVPVLSSRACPYQCIFCHNTFGKKFRKRSPQHFVDEIVMLYDRFAVREFHIIDDVFNIDRDRLRAILDLIIASGMKIRLAFPNGLRGDRLDPEDIRLLQRAGAYMLTMAIETASPRMQSIIRKNMDIPKVLDNINYAAALGLIVTGYFMLGFPGEGADELEETVQAACNSKLDLAFFHVVVPFKGTELFDLSKSLYPRVDSSTYVSYLSRQSFYEAATGFDLARFIKRSYLRFYTANRILRLFYKVPRRSYLLKRFLTAGLGVLKV
jgi:anaerobic magnesium-protoporphyrin IX monomethyl ester cyclase